MWQSGLFLLVVIITLGAFYSDWAMLTFYRSLRWVWRRATGRCLPYCNPGRFERVDAAGNNFVFRCQVCGDRFVW